MTCFLDFKFRARPAAKGTHPASERQLRTKAGFQNSWKTHFKTMKLNSDKKA
jgi:hypothetical protein